ncbi:hypothetical protein QR680_016830 [Steinernema hermaphroditum]|uniref:Nematode cuticle collagen N-terminal domain-containing protein n=1 Tax=Steinernema hermaphroditum TaxID=289476 RepID=A0AA39LMY9_9BILA|nr:hypothetical protein QR680_016830 [Steinernema hermaphroditum]
MSSLLFGSTLAVGSLVVLVLLAASAVVLDISSIHQYGADELLNANVSVAIRFGEHESQELLQRAWTDLHKSTRHRSKRQERLDEKSKGEDQVKCEDCEARRKDCERGPKGSPGDEGDAGGISPLVSSSIHRLSQIPGNQEWMANQEPRAFL